MKNLFVIICSSLLTIVGLLSCGGKKTKDDAPAGTIETPPVVNSDLPGARFKIGDTVNVANCDLSYSSYSAKFKELGFKNPTKDHPCSGGATGVIFGVSEHENLKGTLLYAIRIASGEEFLIQEGGLQRGGNLKNLPDEFLGLYDGIEPGYVMKDEFDQEIIYNNKKMTIPSVVYRFLIESGNTIKLQMTNLEDNTQDRYTGRYYIIKEGADSLEVECDLTDTSDKRYGVNRKLILSKTDKNGSCSPSNKKQPYFKIKKIQ
jgi:hypothetical protein